jgi:type I restriction enzyme S subunit
MYGATIGKTSILEVPATTNQAVCACTPFKGIYNIYLLSLLKAYKSRFIGMGAGGAQPNISKEKIIATVIGLPPLTEQYRIVAKVDELMALCDELEKQQTVTNALHETLVTNLLGSLTDAGNSDSFDEAWQRIENNFDTLFTTEHSIDQLKQTILQLAVMGKLVPQNREDEPASELLKKIAKEKVRLVKEGKIKKQAPLPEITEDEKPFDLPKGWEFVQLASLSSLITKGSSPKWQGVSYTENPEDVLFVTSENVGSYQLIFDNKKFVEMKFNEIEPRSVLMKGDYLMNIVGGSIGRTAIYNIDDLANINQAVCLIRIFPNILDNQYLLHFFNSSVCVSFMFDKQVDNARANLSMGNISKFVIPFPPLAEQHLIVSKVDELFAICDALKERIGLARATQNLLAGVVVEQALKSV